jgi:putative NADPH-quinone reductase
VDLVTSAGILVFVYPTWWSGLPAILKGWLERVMVENVGFRFNRRRKVRPALANVRQIVGISTYGSPRLYVSAINDNGRRILTRALRLSTGWRTRRTWLALYAMDTTTVEERTAFLERIRTRVAAM